MLIFRPTQSKEKNSENYDLHSRGEYQFAILHFGKTISRQQNRKGVIYDAAQKVKVNSTNKLGLTVQMQNRSVTLLKRNFSRQFEYSVYSVRLQLFAN